MLFAKKKEALDDQFTVYHEREAPRFATNGSINIKGFEGEGLLKNVCVSGCCLESVTYITIIPGETYEITIIPDSGAQMDQLTITFEASWTKSSELLFEAGFALEADQKNNYLEKYIEQLKMSGVEPEYGNMSQNRRAGQ